MKNFKPGQEVVCTKKDSWLPFGCDFDGSERFPRYNELCRVKAYGQKLGVEVVTLEGYPENMCYGARWFESVVSIDDLTELLQEKSTLLTI